MLGHVHCHEVKDPTHFCQTVQRHAELWRDELNAEPAMQAMVTRGGGVLAIQPHVTNTSPVQASIHLVLDAQDAMGANRVTQLCEMLKTMASEVLSCTWGVAIVSNDASHRVSRAVVVLDRVPEDLGVGIEVASRWAEQDTYRAITSNKGVCNGVEPICLATGNDWRATAAAMHAYAARS